MGQNLRRPQVFTLLAVLIALQIVLSRFLSFYIVPWLRVSFGFLPIAAVGMLLGPAAAAITGALADLVGFFLFPSGPFFPGYTVTAIFTGYIYGSMLKNFHQEASRTNQSAWLKLILCELAVIVFCHIILNTLWGDILYGKAFFAILPSRALKNIVQLPINVLLTMEMALLLKRLPTSRLT